MRTPLHPTFEKRIRDAIEELIQTQITPWSFLNAGPPVRVRRFDGKEMVFQYLQFDGSPREIFWVGYIEPFLEHLCVGEIGAAVTMAKERDVDGRLVLPEVQELLVVGVKKVYAHMADVDQRLRGQGYPERVALRAVTAEVQKMERFIDARVKAEVKMWKPHTKPWIGKLEQWYAGNKGLIWMVGSILAIIGTIGTSVYKYKTSDVDELRRLVYQPLYDDVVKLETSVMTVSIDTIPSNKALGDLGQTGAIERVPGALQTRLVHIFGKATGMHMSALKVQEIVNHEMSSRIMEIRTKETDRAWHEKTSAVLREMSLSKKGMSNLFAMAEGVTHESKGPTWDLRDRDHPVIAAPGGPFFVVRDWLEYPEVIKKTIDGSWKETDFLYFNQTRLDDWYYRLTREDLKRIDTSLEQYVKPVYDILKDNPDFKWLLTQRPTLLSEITSLKDAMRDRVHEPKQIPDLWDWVSDW